ncbi:MULTISPECIES: DUF4062 domain-containing protein [Polaromonas]|uniref:DUF4062 domain-containing protein n=1 Tax=Polaromonas aquatica TaxID=332657 RepID=A0ABW1TRL1_9BURK
MTRTVFVSSTFVDLQTHRKAIWDMLAKFDVTVRGMEQFGARTETPLQTCLIEVDQSDIYVGVMSFRLGSIEPTSGKSYTQLEYERAIALSKKVFIYLVDEENALVPVRFIDRGESQEKLDSFKSILRERHTIETYTNEADLVAKVKRDLERHISPRGGIESNPDEFSFSAARLKTFMLLPKAVAGTEIRLRLHVEGRPYPASRVVCQAFNLEFGGTVGLPISVLEPKGIESSDLPDLYISAKHATELLPIAKGDVLDGYMKMHFSSKKIDSVRARFRPHTDYPNISAAASVLGEAVHYEADSRLALELSKTLEFKSGSASAV